MKTAQWIFLALGFSLFGLSGCKKTKDDNNCLSFSNAAVTKVEGPTTGNANQVINLTVSFGCFNGCGQFGNFEQVSTGNSTNITVVAKYQGCICTQDAPIRKATYSFKASQPGMYYLNFLQTKGTYLTYSILVQ